MSDLIRCPECKGQKKVVGMGMMQHDCTRCKAVGHVMAEEKEQGPTCKATSSMAPVLHDDALCELLDAPRQISELKRLLDKPQKRKYTRRK